MLAYLRTVPQLILKVVIQQTRQGQWLPRPWPKGEEKLELDFMRQANTVHLLTSGNLYVRSQKPLNLFRLQSFQYPE